MTTCIYCGLALQPYEGRLEFSGCNHCCNNLYTDHIDIHNPKYSTKNSCLSPSSKPNLPADVKDIECL